MYEEYLEDYFYKIVAKIASKFCIFFKLRKSKSKKTLDPIKELKNNEDTKNDESEGVENSQDTINEKNNIIDSDKKIVAENKALVAAEPSESDDKVKMEEDSECKRNEIKINYVDQDLNSLNFHMMMFILWLLVTFVNVPALITWARNFK